MGETVERVQPVSVVVSAKVVVEPLRLYTHPRKDETDMQAHLRELDAWAKDLRDFLHGHAEYSRDYVTVEQEVQKQCSVCGGLWEVDEGNCANCGRPVVRFMSEGGS